MRIAAFENEPEAAATATMLRERGYDTQIVTRDDGAYEDSLRDFFHGKPRTYKPHAFVISGDADYEPFKMAAQRHYGFVIRGSTD